ncbi:DUF2207 domain-containing protein [Gordonia rhizosphera]|uniref:DUF2207 domain-containing protein n=1 Tax=Gordonia rhizosphera TaxID=83341 RepID=UPI00030F8199|nr:DUF2207 domain-containing protein [Gordonia rhizosphera]
MKRVLLSIAALVLTVIGLVLPMSLFPGSTETVGTDPVTITDYRATYDVSADGRMAATETITADFPYGRHGIFRFWDVTDATDSSIRYLPQDIHVALDNGRVPVEMSWQKGKRFRVAKIGDPDSYLTPGLHVYTISYVIDGVLAPASGTPDGQNSSSSWSGGAASRFSWRVVADGWQMTILKSSTTVNLPDDPISTSCSTSDDTACQITANGQNSRTITTGELAPSTGVAIRADLPLAAPDRVRLPWPPALDPVLGRSVPIAIVLIILSAVTFTLGLLWALRSRESIPLLPVMYEPPADPADPSTRLGPVRTYYVTREAMPSKALAATLLHMADRGIVGLRRHGDDWTITSKISTDEWGRMDPVADAVAMELGIRGTDRSFEADGSVSAGKKLKSAQEGIAAATKAWARSSGAVTPSGLEQLGRLAVGLAFIAAAVLFAFQWLPFSLCVLPIAAFVIGGAGLFTTGVGTRRTLLGRDVWSRAGGFERLLSTTSNQERLDFSARENLYTSYIPYAVAFGCADKWAEKYRTAMGTEPPTPIWFVGGYGSGSPGLFGAGGIDSFEASLSSSLSAYAASQRSSSSSGGGGGGFSGGGGGGGGSW